MSSLTNLVQETIIYHILIVNLRCASFVQNVRWSIKRKLLQRYLSKDQETIATYSVESTTEIMEKPGLWLAGTKFFGMDIPKVTWEDVKNQTSS